MSNLLSNCGLVDGRISASENDLPVKFTFSEKATKIDKIFAVNLTVCSNCQIDGEDFVDFLWPS